MTLYEMNNGDQFKVIKVTLAREVGKRLAEMGFTKGVQGKMIRCALLGDPIQVEILNYQVSIRKSEAIGIEVEPLNLKKENL